MFLFIPYTITINGEWQVYLINLLSHFTQCKGTKKVLAHAKLHTEISVNIKSPGDKYIMSESIQAIIFKTNKK